MEYINDHQPNPTHPTLKSVKTRGFLHLVFDQQGRNVPASDKILQENAKYVYKKITERDDFPASSVWLDKFKKMFKT